VPGEEPQHVQVYGSSLPGHVRLVWKQGKQYERGFHEQIIQFLKGKFIQSVLPGSARPFKFCFFVEKYNYDLISYYMILLTNLDKTSQSLLGSDLINRTFSWIASYDHELLHICSLLVFFLHPYSCQWETDFEEYWPMTEERIKNWLPVKIPLGEMYPVNWWLPISSSMFEILRIMAL